MWLPCVDPTRSSHPLLLGPGVEALAGPCEASGARACLCLEPACLGPPTCACRLLPIPAQAPPSQTPFSRLPNLRTVAASLLAPCPSPTPTAPDGDSGPVLLFWFRISILFLAEAVLCPGLSLCFINKCSVNLHHNHHEEQVLFYRWGNRGPEWLSSLPKATQPAVEEQI